MASTTINAGLEIWRLAWKDDAFRQADWYDNTTNNAITFYNGTVTTVGAFGTSASPVKTNGDELDLVGGFTIEKDFGTTSTVMVVPAANVGAIRLRAKNAGAGSVTLTIYCLDSTFSVIVGATQTVTLASSLYTHYTIPLSITTDIGGIALFSSQECFIDYIALATCTYINQGGESFTVAIPKKTISQTIPNSYDIVQQMGISSRSNAIMIPKTAVATYRWLEDLMVNAIPIELITPTQQATGYVSDLKRHSEAGWVGTPLPSSDSLALTGTTRGELYDVSFSLIRADAEQNIDTTATPCSQAAFAWSISLNPTGGTVSKGDEPTTITTTATLTLLGGIGIPVTLSNGSLPSGTTVTFGTNPVTPTDTSLITIHATTTPVGMYTIVITGNDGTDTHSASYALHVLNTN